MSSWSKAGKEVRLILFECLNRPEAKNIYFNPVQCAELCNLAAGLDFCRGIDSLRIGRAFSNGGESDYSLQFNQLIIGSDATHFLHVLIDKRMDGERYTAVGCFTSEVERIKALQRLKSDNNIKLSFRQWGLEYIRSSVIGIAFQKQYGEKTIESAVAQPRKRAISTQQSTNELYAAEQNRLKTKAEIEKLREELAKIERRGKEIKELIRTKINECEGILDSPMNVDEEVMLRNENANKTMNIIMDGRAACIPRDDVIYMVDIVHSLSSDEPYKSFDGGYRKMKLGSKEYLLPRGVEACSTQQFNEMRRRYVYIRNLFNLLKKEKFSFSQDAQNYLALGCHVNSGGSDKASVAIMTCTMRALLLEMGIPESIITNEMIAKSFPSRSTMKNLEFRLGADCSIMVCYEIDINNVSHISWTVDHGNRGDVNHFPKQISIGSRDNDNNPVIRAYCFDAPSIYET